MYIDSGNNQPKNVLISNIQKIYNELIKKKRGAHIKNNSIAQYTMHESNCQIMILNVPKSDLKAHSGYWVIKNGDQVLKNKAEWSHFKNSDNERDNSSDEGSIMDMADGDN